MNWLFSLLTALVVALFLGSLFGPRETIDWTIYVAPGELPDDLDAYLAEVEAREMQVTTGAEKRIEWHGAVGEKTPLAVVYLHGFSATHREIAPAPEMLADALGANLYLARLSGHGQPGAALAAATANDWLNDTVEAIEIGARLGERVLLVSASTGGTLSIAAAALPGLSAAAATGSNTDTLAVPADVLEYSAPIAGLVLMSPNLEIAQSGSWLLTKPFARLIVPLIAGSEVSWEPINEAQENWWTTRYPVQATFQLGALVSEVRAINPRGLGVPAYFVYSDADTVVNSAATRDFVRRWGGPVEEWVITPGEGMDPASHVLAGDILSPAMTAPFVERIAAWAKGL